MGRKAQKKGDFRKIGPVFLYNMYRVTKKLLYPVEKPSQKAHDKNDKIKILK